MVDRPAEDGATHRARRRSAADPGAARVVVVGSALLVVVAVASLFVGVSRLSPADLWPLEGEARRILLVSRVPRLVAILLAGSAMGVAGLIMQALTRNRFVEPSTAGTTEAAGLGVVVALVWFGSASILERMLIAVAFALAATGLFLAILQRLRFRDALLVPLVGITFGGVIQALTMYLAYRFDLLQVANTLTSGNFATVLRGRYELLWVTGALTVVAYAYADRLTLAGMGRDVSISLGLPYERAVATGLAIVATVTACIVVVVGMVPFLGLVVPNIATAVLGDNLRRVLPATALGGALLVLVCDIVGRTVRAPYEIPVGTVAGVVGGAVFLALVVRWRGRAA